MIPCIPTNCYSTYIVLIFSLIILSQFTNCCKSVTDFGTKLPDIRVEVVDSFMTPATAVLGMDKLLGKSIGIFWEVKILNTLQGAKGNMDVAKCMKEVQQFLGPP